MALGGDLRNIKLADIFQTLSMNRQEGMLVVRSGQKRKKVRFWERGVSLVSERTISAFRLGAYLAGTGRITTEDLRIALQKQRETGMFLGETLVSLGLCRDTDVEDVVRYHAAEELYEIFTWDHGSFEFHEGGLEDLEQDSSPFSTVAFDPGALVMEAARRMDEWEMIRKHLPNDDDFLLQTGKEGSRLDAQVWGPDLASVYPLVDGVRNVGEIFLEHHLSAFDTGTLMVELIRHELIRPSTFDELTAAAEHFLTHKNADKGTQCLERAHALAPDDTDTIVQLADCYERLDEKKAAGNLLSRLGKLHLDAGQAAEAVNALEKAEKYDPGSLEIPTRLMRIYLDLGDAEMAAEKARAAAEIHCEREDFEDAIDLCREVLASGSRNLGIRITLANALIGCDERDQALEELEDIATSLEESRNYRKLPDVYRKILQLDSSRREYLHRLEDLKEGHVRRRKRVLRFAACGGAGLTVLMLSLLLFAGGSSSEDRLAQAWELFRAGRPKQAEAIAAEIMNEEPGSDVAFQAKNLISAIWTKDDTGSGQATAQEDYKEKADEALRKSSEMFETGLYDEGLEQLLAFTDFQKSEECKEILRKLSAANVKKIKKRNVERVRSLLVIYADSLETTAEKERQQLSTLEDIQLEKSEMSEIWSICDQADRIRTATGSDLRRRNIDTADVIEVNLCGGSRKIAERLFSASEALDKVHRRAEALHHRARALIRKEEVYQAFTDVKTIVNDLMSQGDLEKAREACRGFLSKCKKLEAERPAKYYAQVVEELLGPEGLDLDAKMQSELTSVETVLGSIDRAEGLISEKRFDDANALLRDLIRNNFRIDFRDRIRLAMWIRTRPVGAEVQLAWNAETETTLGHTTEDGLLVRYAPHGETILTVRKNTFEPVVIAIRDFEDECDGAPVLEMKKQAEWTRRGGGPIQATPGIGAGTLLVPSRDGHLRGISVEDGSVKSDHDSGLLSGFGCSPVLVGRTAYLAAIDRQLLAFDLDEWKVTWTFKTGAALRTEPGIYGDLVIVADEDANVYGVRNGREVWSRQLEGRVFGSPAYTPNAVFIGTTEGIVYRLAPTTGEVVWQRSVGGPVYASLAFDAAGRVLAGTDASEILAIDARSGEIQWRTPVDNAVRGCPVLRDGKAHIATLGGSVFQIDIENGQTLTALTLPQKQPIQGGLTLGKDCIYVVDENGQLSSLDPKHGVRWTFDLKEKTSSAPLLIGDRLYVATDGGDVYCFLE